MFSIPSDRLHKFAAIAGLSIATGGATMGYSAYVERVAYLERGTEQLRVTRKERDILLLQQLAAATDSFVERCATAFPNEEDRRIQCQIEGAEKSLAGMKKADSLPEVEIKLQVEERAHTDQLFESYDHYKTRMWLSIGVAVAGFLVSVLGFWLWVRADRAPKRTWPKIGDA